MSLVSYGNPQTGMLDVRPTCVKQRNAQQRNMIGGKETCTFDTEVTNQMKLFEELMCRHHTLPFRGDLKRTYGEYTPVVECKGMANVAHHYVLI